MGSCGGFSGRAVVADFPARELLVTTVMVQKVSPTWPYESGGVLVFDSSFFFPI